MHARATSTFSLIHRLRRLRQHSVLRDLVRETTLNLQDLILPLFIKGIDGANQPIASMPGHYQIPLSCLAQEIEDIVRLGISSVILFGIPSYKDSLGSSACESHGIIQEAITLIRKVAPHLLIISDLCFCEYTDHGHCGILSNDLDVDNDETLSHLITQAISHAKAGVHVIAPSGMMDGAVKALRHGLDEAGFSHLPLLSYSVKYCSSFYGPFRMAAEGAPSQGDRSSHQMDPANGQEALREVHLDVEEGADMLMVKPAHSYLDVIYRIKQAYPYIPLGAYHTSGEFGMIKAAAEKGWLNEEKAVLEILTSIRRAGADFIITYYAKEVAKWRLLQGEATKASKLISG
jgi:porphobilinogen synthase